MVPVANNIYALRAFLSERAVGLTSDDPHKRAWLRYTEFPNIPASTSLSTQNYLRCAAAGLNQQADTRDLLEDLNRLLGQAPFIDGTPMPWVSDTWAILAIKLAVDLANDADTTRKFNNWVGGFLPERLKENRLDAQERTIAEYIINGQLPINPDATVSLFLHYKSLVTINDDSEKNRLKEAFYREHQAAQPDTDGLPLIATTVFVLDAINRESSAVPPNSWSLTDLMTYLENVPVGLKRWTWEDKSRTKGGNAVKWYVENEYHVQNLLYALLAPTFTNIVDEIYAEPVGQKSPRIDLYLPSSNILIEVKYRKDRSKSFQDFIGEVAEDYALYRSDARFKDSEIIVFLWDHTRSTQEHQKFKEGVLKIGFKGCVVVSSPSFMV